MNSKRKKNISRLAIFSIEVYNKLCYNHFIARMRLLFGRFDNEILK